MANEAGVLRGGANASSYQVGPQGYFAPKAAPGVGNYGQAQNAAPIDFAAPPPIAQPPPATPPPATPPPGQTPGLPNIPGLDAAKLAQIREAIAMYQQSLRGGGGAPGKQQGFDPAAYLAANPALQTHMDNTPNFDPLKHWTKHGQQEGRPSGQPEAPPPSAVAPPPVAAPPPAGVAPPPVAAPAIGSPEYLAEIRKKVAAYKASSQYL